MTETEKDRAKYPGGAWLPIVAFLVADKVLSIWLIRPLALGVALLILLLLTYALGERKVAFGRWLLFSCLIAVLFPGIAFGATYLLCAHRLHVISYLLLMSALGLPMHYLVSGLLGKPMGSARGWALAGLCLGVLQGAIYYFSPGPFCSWTAF